MDLALILVSMVTVAETKSVVKLSEPEQRKRLNAAQRKCLEEIRLLPIPVNVKTCAPTWDGVLCWGYHPAGTLAKQNCPIYINNFDTDAVATRDCLPDGNWYFNAEENNTWTNFSRCVVNDSGMMDIPDVPDIIQMHMPKLRLMYSVGYSVSLIALFIAVFIMLFFKKLHCQRNRIHLNLFASFILKGVLSLLRETILSEGGAFLPGDVMYGEDDTFQLAPGPLWECKLLQTTFHFVIGANYTWIFLEGMYLHMLIFVSYFTDKNKLKWYMLFGWGFPLLSVVPWVVVRIHFEDVFCWLTNSNSGYFWILRGPIVASIIANFIFFLNIVRVLAVKLRASNNKETKKFRYRRLAKSTLVLIPLFGVHYMVFVLKPDHVEATAELVLLYIELFLNSFQGFMVTMLFCFLNGEVQAEVMKMWQRRQFSRGGSFRSKTWTSLSSHWNRHRTTEMEKERIRPRRCFLFRSRGSDSAFSRHHVGSESIEMSSAADRCVPSGCEHVQMKVIKEVREDVSKSSSKEESGQSDHNDNFNSFAVTVNRVEQEEQEDFIDSR